MRPYIPDFQYHLTDFSYKKNQERIGNKWIQAYGHVVQGLSSRQPEELLSEILQTIFELEGFELGMAYIREILYYIGVINKKRQIVDKTVLLEKIREVSSQGAEEMATIAEQWIEEGIEIGELQRARKIARQLLKLHDITTVSELTGLPLEEVQALADELENTTD